MRIPTDRTRVTRTQISVLASGEYIRPDPDVYISPDTVQYNRTSVLVAVSGKQTTRVNRIQVNVAASDTVIRDPSVYIEPPYTEWNRSSALIAVSGKPTTSVNRIQVNVAASDTIRPDPDVYTEPPYTEWNRSSALIAVSGKPTTRVNRIQVNIVASDYVRPPPDVYIPPDSAQYSRGSALVVGSGKLTTRINRIQVNVAASDTVIPDPDRYNEPPSTRWNRGMISVAATEVQKSYVNVSRMIASVVGQVIIPKDNLELESWTFDQDGHVFYVLKMGMDGTFVYDITTEQWSQWITDGAPTWHAERGILWKGKTIAIYPGTNDIIELVPDGYRDHEGKMIKRSITSVLDMTMRNHIPVGVLYVDASYGASNPAEPPTMTLKISDNGGKSWQVYGPIEIDPNNFSYPIAFRSLGLIKYPGRIFIVEDEGGPIRIAGLDINNLGGDE